MAIGVIGCIISVALFDPQASVPISVEYTQPKHIPTVYLKGIKDAQVYGAIHGDVRVILGSEVIQSASGAFVWPAGPLLTHQVTVSVPAGMNFVASRNGKKYYPITAAKVRSLVPKNRMYFQSALEAEAAGFVR